MRRSEHALGNEERGSADIKLVRILQGLDDLLLRNREFVPAQDGKLFIGVFRESNTHALYRSTENLCFFSGRRGRRSRFQEVLRPRSSSAIFGTSRRK